MEGGALFKRGGKSYIKQQHINQDGQLQNVFLRDTFDFAEREIILFASLSKEGIQLILPEWSSGL